MLVGKVRVSASLLAAMSGGSAEGDGAAMDPPEKPITWSADARGGLMGASG